MTIEISRADVLRGRFIANSQSVRPPYALTEPEFQMCCERCDKCRSACETGVIKRDGEGYPVLNFEQAKCSFCGACAAACPTGALSPANARAWDITAHVKGSCLSFNAVTCRACEENCEPGAISFRLMAGGRALPIINEENCTGCGNCALTCPTQSIEMRSHNTQELVA